MTISRALVFSALLRSSISVLVAPNSQCGPDCGNVLSATTSTDIVCKAGDFGKSAGVVWEGCIDCELHSSYTTLDQGKNVTDLQAMLYNLRYATAFCLFGVPDNDDLGNNPCQTRTACGPLRDAITYDNLTSGVSAEGYCSVWPDEQVPHCNECLEDLDGGHYLKNYMNILDGYCRMLPPPGETLTVKGDIFSTTDTVNVTEATPTAPITRQLTGPLGLGGIVGVVIGGVVFLLILIGCGIVINGKRRRKAYLRRRERQRKNWPSPLGGGEMFETPVSQRPLRGWDESPVSASTDPAYPRYFSPYSSQYNSPVSASDGPNHTNWPVEKNINIGIALSPDADPGSNPYWGDKKGKDVDRDGIELQEGVSSGGGIGQYPYVPPPPPHNNAPILGHPGYGRHGPAPQHPGSLTEEDHWSGRAV